MNNFFISYSRKTANLTALHVRAEIPEDSIQDHTEAKSPRRT